MKTTYEPELRAFEAAHKSWMNTDSFSAESRAAKEAKDIAGKAYDAAVKLSNAVLQADYHGGNPWKTTRQDYKILVRN